MKFKYLVLLLSLYSLVACESKQSAPQQIQYYSLLEIDKSDISLDQSYSASIKGRQDIKIIPRVDGYLTDISVKEGEKVKKGQVLFIIDQVPFKAQLESAKASVAVCEASVATAELTYKSKKALFEKQIVSEFDLQSAQNALLTAKAHLEQAKAQEVLAKNQLSYTVIKSPSDGVVGKLPYRKGDYVGPQMQEGLTVVAENSTMYIYFSLTERQMLDIVSRNLPMDEAIKAMPQVELILSNGTRYPQKGTIESISGVVDASTGAVSVRAAFPNENGHLLSGGTGSIVMPYEYNEVIVIPHEATYEIQDKTYAFKIVDGKATSVIIDVQKINNGKQFIVTDGLSVGDVIIAEGAGLVQEGMEVKNKEEK